MQNSSFWEKEENYQLVAQLANLKELFSFYSEIKKIVENQKELNQAQKARLKEIYFGSCFKKIDQQPAILNIYSGVGGKDAEDWVGILAKMYQKLAEKLNWEVKILSQDQNEYGGYKFISFEISGFFAYGILKNENGVHRLVRISPFSSAKLRHTSFALVEVLPSMDFPEIEIKDKDLEFETFRASGPGGQRVNKVETAVRVIYKPLNLSAVCQSERSQYQNKVKALKILKSKIKKYLEEKKAKTIEELRGAKLEPSWGHQKRSYIMHPYKLVKDHRLNIESKNLSQILEGNLEVFLPEVILV